MKIKINCKILIISFFLITQSCDHGINPEKPDQIEQQFSGISGTIYYQNWPPQDSLLDLRLVVFKNYPPADIVSEVTTGEAIAYPEISLGALPFYVDSTDFELNLDPRIYAYVVVAQQYGPAIFFDWRVVGQYDTTSFDTLPTSIEIFSDSIVSNINIYVDFDSLPGQPF